MLSIPAICEAVKLGAKLETLIPAGADLAYWQRLVNRNLNSDPSTSSGKPKRKASKKQLSRKTSKRTFRASSVLNRNQEVAGAMAEQLDRVNGKVEARSVFVTANGRTELMVL